MVELFAVWNIPTLAVLFSLKLGVKTRFIPASFSLLSGVLPRV